MSSGRKFSFIIPAFNEENYLPDTLTSVQQLISNSSLKGEIVVVDNNSTDKTAEIAENLGAKVVFEPINQISKARNAGGRSCPDSDYLIFLDADSTISAEILNEIIKLLESGKFCGGGVVFDMDGQLGKFLASAWALIAKLASVSGGACIFCLNEAFKETGGYSEKVYAAEDVVFSRDLKKWGRRNKKKFALITKFKAITSDRKLKWFTKSQIFWQVFTIICMPWRLRNREKMKIWYERPAEKDTEVKSNAGNGTKGN